MTSLWDSDDVAAWTSSLENYDAVVASQGVERLAALDAWYRYELPAALIERSNAEGGAYFTHPELVQFTEWKMARGVWRAPNLVRVAGNDATRVTQVSRDALALVPHATAPIAALAVLDGIGPATASAALAAFAPTTYPFFDELVARQVHVVPALGDVKWTLGYYAKYATALRQRAAHLHSAWTPVMVERALWAHVGGKTGV